MNRADKAVLRLTLGLGLAVLIAYGFALPMPFVVCLTSILVLCKPGPPLPLAKGFVIAAIFAVLLASGVLMVPLLENYAWSGILLTGTILYGIFFFGLVHANPLTVVLVISFAVIPVAGVADQAVVGMLSLTLSIGLLTGALVSSVSNALFPDPPAVVTNRPTPGFAGRKVARWIALRAVVIVMPVFVLAFTNPSFYIAAIMKTVALSEQAGEVEARFAGRELIGSTLMGALLAAVMWLGLSLPPQSLDVDLVDDGRRTMDRQWDLPYAIDVVPPFLLEQRVDHYVDLARPGDRGQRERQERLPGLGSPQWALRSRLVLCVGNGPGTRTLACLEMTQSIFRRYQLEKTRDTRRPHDWLFPNVGVPCRASGNHVLERPLLRAAFLHHGGTS